MTSNGYQLGLIASTCFHLYLLVRRNLEDVSPLPILMPPKRKISKETSNSQAAVEVVRNTKRPRPEELFSDDPLPGGSSYFVFFFFFSDMLSLS